MTEITPTYYAANVDGRNYTLRGFGFGSIPADAVGIIAYDNNQRFSFRNTTDPRLLFDIVEVNEHQIVLEQQQAGSHSTNTYLGAILSADRSEVYWENTTRPLP